MKSFIKNHVVKGFAVEITEPRLLDFNAADFQTLMPHLAIVTVDSGSETDKVRHDPGLCAENEKTQADEILAQAKEEASVIIAKAENQAAGILQKAQAEAEELLAMAKSNAEKICVEAQQSRAGMFTQARSEGYLEGSEAGRVQAAALTEKAERYAELAKRAFQTEYEKADEDLLHLAVKMAERIVRGGLTAEPDRMLQIIRGLSLLPQEREDWLLHLSAEDAETLQGFSFEGMPDIPWVVDSALKQGDCYLVCQEGLFDARLESQLDRFEQELRKEVLQKKGKDNGKVASAS